MARRAVLLGIATIGALFAAPRDAPRAEEIDPTGIWNCLIYASPVIGDERVFLKLSADGSTALLHLADPGARWMPISNWHRHRKRLEFGDARTGRDFDADLSAASLGGTWRTDTAEGGWWCSRASDALLAAARGGGGTAAWLAELVPAVTASPQYPSEAIREAKEGRAVGCFSVNSNGEVVDPVVVELSDEIFREPTLLALSRSRYRGWDDDKVVRPDCRSFTFRLDAVY
ncbi:MAG TPA: energy transducer TonB [Gammaproteobacteria bacterium]|nr:energy transducer TonB [Gammaproteobacteria bacterium]